MSSQSSQKVHKCNICDEPFESEGGLSYHRKIKHSESNEQCNICQIILKSKVTLRVHMKIMHQSSTNSYKCDLCDYEGQHLQHLKAHQRKHKNTNRFQCEVCEKYFSSNKYLRDHIQAYHDGNLEKVKCELCGFQTLRSYVLKQHVNVIHLKLRPYKCDICDKDFPYLYTKKIHMKSIHLIKEFLCDQCEKRFESLQKLQRHEYAVHDIQHDLKIYKCDACEYSSIHLQNVKNHKLQHMANKIMCKEEGCSRTFKVQSQLRIHVSDVHVNKGIIKCDLCDKVLKSTSGMKKHKVVNHSVNRAKIQCDVCELTFTQPRTLRQHKQNIHLKLKPYKCEFCEQTFGLEKLAKLHELKVHIDPDRKQMKYSCDTCDYKAYEKQSFNKHIKIHMITPPEPKVQCDVCQNWFTTKRAMKYHKDSVHLRTKETSCSYCDKTFSVPNMARFHELAQHTDPEGKQKKNICPHCTYKCYQKTDLNKHMQIHKL